MKKEVKKKSKPAKAKKRAAVHAPESFPLVGIGASAGGLEAFSKMLSQLRTDLGMAYVYIQHLDPGHESILTEIFERKTRMPVLTVKNGMEIKADHVYVIPSNHYMTVKDGKLILQPIVKTGAGNHAVDFFFNSLAITYQTNAVGVILSGAASDGTLGLKAIKAEGGITFAQDETAKYQGMPRSAVDSGFVDFIMTPENIAKELAKVANHPSFIAPPREELSSEKNPDFKRILVMLHLKRKVDFTHYKTNTIHRRILRRMLLNRFKKLEEYSRFLKNNNTELDALYQDLLIHVTTFFREPKIFDALSRRVWPSLLKNRSGKDAIRIWIPGCATGEEAYSIAISLYEYLGIKALAMPVQIFATDLNESNIEQARLGIYAKSVLQNISPERMRRFFVKMNGHYQVVKSIRDVCIFATHNLLKDPPFSHMDLISCQNVLIYLEGGPQQRILQAFHYALKPEGMLALGKSESIGNAGNLFKGVDKEHKIFLKKAAASHFNLDFAVNITPELYLSDEIEEQSHPSSRPETKSEDNLEKEVDKMLLTKYVPASIIVNSDYEIIRFRGNTSPYLQPAAGKASLSLIRMVRDELAYDLRALLHKAKKEGHAIRKETIPITDNGTAREISLEIVPVSLSNKQLYFLIIFQQLPVFNSMDAKNGKDSRDNQKHNRILLLEKQLKEERDHMKTISEEFEATREELQSANEEVLSSNEELQSINEELETSKEELQSAVEELTTINEELTNRNEELRTSRDYAEAMVATIREPIIVLSYDLRVHSANRAFYKYFETTPEKMERNFLNEVEFGHLDTTDLRKNLRGMRTNTKSTASFNLHYTTADKEKRLLHVNAHALKLKEGTQDLVLLAMKDGTAAKLK